MIPNENARAMCRDCHCLIIPVTRNKKVGVKVGDEFVRTDDTILQFVCPLCESVKIDRLPDETESSYR